MRYARKKKSFRGRGRKYGRPSGRKYQRPFRKLRRTGGGSGKLRRKFRRAGPKRYRKSLRRTKKLSPNNPTLNAVMDNIYPWKNYVVVSRVAYTAPQNRRLLIPLVVGNQASIQTLFSAQVLNYANPSTTHIRDGVQTKRMRAYFNLRNNSTATYSLDIYWAVPRFDANASFTDLLNQSLINEGITYGGSQASYPNNLPPNLSMFELPSMTAHFILRKSQRILRPGVKWSFMMRARNIENTVRNSAILVGNGTNYQRAHAKYCIIFVKGTLGHESTTGIPVLSEVTGLDLEVTNQWTARLIKEPTTIGNRTTYANDIVNIDVENTYVGVDSGARVAIVSKDP